MAQSRSITREVSEFVTGLTFDSLPADVVERARTAVVDGVGLMLAGARAHCTQVLRRYLRTLGLAGTVTAVGAGLRLPAEYAALHNGVAAHADDYDDTQISSLPDRVYGLLTHPTTPVLGAALAVAEETAASGKELLAAYVAGVEVACKVAEAIKPYHYRNGFHSTGTIGVIGAAAAAAKLLKLDEAKTRMAIGIAASKSAGIRVAFGTMTKPYHAGAAAENGVVAAKLASFGFETDPEALDGPWGFFQVAGGGCDPEVILDKLGKPFALVEPGVSIKPYPCGSLLHPTMDGVLDLVLEHDIRPEQVEEVRLGTSSNVLAALRYPEPQNELQAKFSITFGIAILLLERKAGLRQFTDEVVRRPDVQAMLRKVQPYLHKGIEAKGFQRIRSLIEVKLTDGRTLSKETWTSRGTPDRPMTHEEVAAKFHDCAEGTLDAATADQAITLIRRLEQMDDVRRLTRLVLGATPQPEAVRPAAR